MNSRVSWSVDGIDPSVRDRAEAAARRAGMSLNDWLNSTVGEPSPPDWRMEQRQPMPSRESREVADIHQRLDAITRQIEQIAKPLTRAEAVRAEVPRGQPAVARQLNDAISRLDARLSQISRPQPAREPQPMREPQMQREPQITERQLEERLRQAEAVERAAAQVYRPSPPLSPASFDSAIAEIAARQNELDGPPSRQMPPRNAPPLQQPASPMAAHAAPAAPTGPDFSSLERHLLKITSQIEALQRPDHVEQSIAAFRGELAEIRQAITEAMPRRAIESIENEIRSLHHRIDELRQDGRNGQGQAIAGIERALSEIRESLRTLTPAEQLTGYDEAIRNLGAKLDMILRANDDPSTVHQLESAIAALRAIVSNVASNDALLQLSGDVHALSTKVDQLSQMSRAESRDDAFAGIEQRIAALASSLESRERPVGHDNTDAIESAMRTLSERIDRLQVGNDSSSAFTHLEQRVSYLLERLESADQRSGNLGRVEEGLHDIMRHLEAQHAHIASLADAARSNVSTSSPQPMMDTGIVDLVKRELSDIRFSQSETDRRTQDSLETVHNTLGHVVDRLAMIENDLRTVRTAPPAPPAPAYAEPRIEAPRTETPRAATPQPRPESYQPESYRPELPNPALAQEHFMSAPREFHAAQPVETAPPPLPPRAISEILEPHAASARAAIAPELPPDHPLEPGTRPSGRASSPSERIADSERAISDLPAGKKEPVSTSSFIAAARRAAQAAAAQPVNEKAARAANKAAAKAKDKADKAAKAAAAKAGASAAGAPEAQPSTITSKIRSLLVGASVVVILLSTAKMAMNLLDTSSAPQAPAIEHSEPAAPSVQPPAENSIAPAPAPAMPSGTPGPSMTSPTPLGRQSNNTAAPNTLDSAQVTIPQAPAPAAAPEPAAPPVAASSDITGTIPTAPPLGGKLATIQIPAGEKLPDAIGGPALRTAAIKGDAAAAYEVGVRFAEGKGVPANVDEAAKWYGRAAQAGVVPAMFRLGTFYEKGLSVKRDFDVARRFYVQAAERGNAKAMHNLAVLDADGGGKGADYKSAAQWFRKAADRGVADSQVNLGILYARGIGVEQNLAESFKWFSLAAAQGDADAGHKRDDIAKRLDPQSLAAAKLAIQTFTPEPQPSDAVNVPAPAGGWDGAAAQPAAAKPVKQLSKRTAALAAPAH